METWWEYKIILRDFTTHAKEAEFNDFEWLTYRNEVNKAGIARLLVSRNHQYLDEIKTDNQIIEIWRKSDYFGVDWALDFEGIMRKPEKFDDDKVDYFLAQYRHLNHLLSWRIVAWPAGIENYSFHSNKYPDRIFYEIFSRNIGSSALASGGRLRDGYITVMDNASIGDVGTQQDWYYWAENCLETFQKLADAAGFDFAVAWYSTTSKYRFTVYQGQLGTDRSASLRFSTALGNMKNPRQRADHENEKTVAIIGGPGEGLGRLYEIETGPDYHATNNNIEMFIDAKSIETEAGRAAKAATKLEETRAKEEFDFEAVQTEACQYGLHYFLGDKAKAVYDGTTYTIKVNAVSVSLTTAGEKLNAELVTM